MQRLTISSFWSRYRGTPFDSSELAQALKRLPAVAATGPWLAGGAVRRTIQNEKLDSDFDFFFASAEQFQSFCTDMDAKGAKKERETDFNITFRIPAADKLPELKVQAIRASYHPTLEAMLASFDFSLCQTGYDGTDLVLGPWTLYDLARKRLIPGQISYGVSSLRRMIKYTSQGYSVCAGGLGNMLKQIVDKPEIINQKIVSID